MKRFLQTVLQDIRGAMNALRFADSGEMLLLTQKDRILAGHDEKFDFRNRGHIAGTAVQDTDWTIVGKDADLFDESTLASCDR